MRYAFCLFCLTLPVWGQPRDLQAVGLEVTQTIQDLNNSVRLVAGKRTFVRFHVRSPQGAQISTAELRATRGGQSITLPPTNPGGAITIVANPNRAVRDQAFLFELPDGYRQGEVSLRAEVNPAGDVADPNVDNDVRQLTVRFETVPPLYLVIYGFTYTGDDGVRYSVDDKEIRQMANWMQRAWPVPGVLFWIRHEDITSSMGPGLPDCSTINEHLNLKRMADLQSPGNRVPANARYYGMVSDKGGFMRGCADGLPGFASSGPTGVPDPASSLTGWDTDGSFGDWYGSHEVAHNYSRYHAEFCNAAAGRPFPNPGGAISPVATGAAAIMGYDHLTHSVLSPGWTDNMAYCRYQWMSKFTYTGLMDGILSNVGAVEPESLKNRARAAGTLVDRMLVVGTVDLNKPGAPTAQLAPIYVLKDAFEVAARVPGDYAIVLKAGDRELASYPFTPSTMISGAAAKAGEPELDFRAIHELVAYVDGTTVVDVTGPGRSLLATVKAGPAFPVVTVQEPAGGETIDEDEVKVSWMASDADGDKLFYAVQYSPDNGQNWVTVAEDIAETSVLVDRYEISGSSTALFRVLATDGIRTTTATSNPFTIAERSAFVELVGPPDGRAYVSGETIAFEAYAYDVDAGEVADEKVVWTSSIDGRLGTGVEFEYSKLSVGEHTITVSVADDGSREPVTATVMVRVVAKRADLPVVADKLLVEPDVLLFTAGAELIDVFEVDNENWRNALDWTATADKSWIKLDAASGTTPGLVTVTLVNPPAESAAGTITVTSATGAKATIRVDYNK